MPRYRHNPHFYKGRKVAIRGKGGILTDVSQLEQMVRDDYNSIWKEHIEDLEGLAEDIQNNAEILVPLDKGALQESIEVRVSKSRRYPGLIAHASATNAGYDYALIQEENEDYNHDKTVTYKDDSGKTVESLEDSGRMAHYLGGSFALFLSYYYEDITGEELVLPAELEHAKEYIE